MRLKVITKNSIVSVLVENLVVHAHNRDGVLFEVSCPNKDVYRFKLVQATEKNQHKFIEMCKNVAMALEHNRDTFVCSFEEFEGIKFEKLSLQSNID